MGSSANISPCEVLDQIFRGIRHRGRMAYLSFVWACALFPQINGFTVNRPCS